MCEVRLQLIQNVNNMLQREVNNWLTANCDNVFIEQAPNSDFCYNFKRENNFINLTEIEMQNLYVFFNEQLIHEGIGFLICPNKIYFGIAHLSIASLRRLQAGF